MDEGRQQGKHSSIIKALLEASGLAPTLPPRVYNDSTIIEYDWMEHLQHSILMMY